MISQLFKIIWNQRGRNSWIFLELFIIFIVMWFIIDYFIVLMLINRIPTHVDVDHTYQLVLSKYQPDNPGYQAYEEGSDEPFNNFNRIINRVKNYDGIESLCLTQTDFPYKGGISSSAYKLDSIVTYSRIEWVTPEYFEVFQIHPYPSGTPENLGVALKNGVVISQSLNEALFPGGSLVGRDIFDYKSENEENPIRVGGTMQNLKPSFFERSTHYLIGELTQKKIAEMSETDLWNLNICFRIHAEQDKKTFVEEMAKEMKQQLKAGNFFMADIIPIEEYKHQYYDISGIYTDIYYYSDFSFFFMVSLFLGVIGTFWLRINKRRGEMGLRMAIGSTRREIGMYITLESLLLFAIAFIPALFVCLNMVFLDLLSTERMDVAMTRFLLNTLITSGVLGFLSVLASAYPALRSAGEQPAEALHYE